jgi:hypothetical protein
MSSRKPRVWVMPIALAAASVVGLVAALVSDDLGDTLAWLTLAVPVVVVAWYWARPRQS